MNPQERRPSHAKAPFLWHGGDFSPEQWPPELLETDLRLMDDAHCQVFSVGIFSWAALEPSEGRFDFDWLDRVLDAFAERGKFAALATPSAAMPGWLAQKHPDVLRVEPDGGRRRFGERVNHCWSSPEYRRRCREMAERLAKRYGKHPAVVLWHVSNEYNGACHCERCADAFREWLRGKFDGDLGRLNHEYWSAFWGHTYTNWSQITIPVAPYGDLSIIGLRLDWKRFVSDQIIDFFLNESKPLRELTDIPITTNLMGTYPGIDYWELAKHMDVIAWDSYPRFTDGPMKLSDWQFTAFRHDLNRSFHQKPFILIESSPGSSNWYPVMEFKRPGEHRMEGMQALAHGSDAVMYFQWRQSRGCQEKFHGAVVQHDGGSDTRIFQEVAELGKTLEGLKGLVGAETRPQAAVVYDWENEWAIDLAGGPRRTRMGYHHECLQWYGAFWKRAIPVDVIESESELDSYRVVVAPMLYLVKPGVAERLESYVAGGGTLILTYYSGCVNENDLVFQGGFPGPLRKLAGVWVEEIEAVQDGVANSIRTQLDGLKPSYAATHFFERIHAESAEVLATFESDFYAGMPALTRNRFEKGETYYVSTRVEPQFAADFIALLAESKGLESDWAGPLPVGVFARCRRAADADYVFLINFKRDSARVEITERDLKDAESGEIASGQLELPPYGSRVLVRTRVATTA